MDKSDIRIPKCIEGGGEGGYQFKKIFLNFTIFYAFPKSNLPNQTFQIKSTKPNLLNQTYRTKPTEPNLSNQTYQTKPTEPKQTYQHVLKSSYFCENTEPLGLVCLWLFFR